MNDKLFYTILGLLIGALLTTIIKISPEKIAESTINKFVDNYVAEQINKATEMELAETCNAKYNCVMP